MVIATPCCIIVSKVIPTENKRSWSRFIEWIFCLQWSIPCILELKLFLYLKFIMFTTRKYIEIRNVPVHVYIKIINPVKPVLRDHCFETPPLWKTTIFWHKNLLFKTNKRTCHQRPPVLRDHIYLLRGVVFQDRFHCVSTIHKYDSLAFERPHTVESLFLRPCIPGMS